MSSYEKMKRKANRNRNVFDAVLVLIVIIGTILLFTFSCGIVKQLPVLTYESYLDAANKYEAENDYQMAMQNYDKSIQLNAKNCISFYERGICKMKMGRLLDALSDFTFALQLNPDMSNAYFQRGMCYFRLNNKERACENWGMAADRKNKQAEEYHKKFCE